jgi:hypothetical protein
MTDKGERIEKIGHWGECDRCNTEHFNEGQIKELGFEYLCAKCIKQIKREAAEKVIACCPDYPSENCHGQCDRLIEEAKQEVKKETLCPNHDNRPKIFCSKCADTIKDNAEAKLYCPIWQCGGTLGAVEGKGKGESDWQLFEMQCSNFKDHRFVLKNQARQETLEEVLGFIMKIWYPTGLHQSAFTELTDFIKQLMPNKPSKDCQENI